MKKFFIAAAMAMTFRSASAADIVDTAKSAGSFNTLVTALETAGLVDTLKGPGPFTIQLLIQRYSAVAMTRKLNESRVLSPCLNLSNGPGRLRLCPGLAPVHSTPFRIGEQIS